jgi:betaine reductase
MGRTPVIKACTYNLIHTPDFVLHGSKPVREITLKPEIAGEIKAHLRTFEQAVSYAPNQVFLGGRNTGDLETWPKPWWKNPVLGVGPDCTFGSFRSQKTFYGLLKASDLFNLVWLTPEFTAELSATLKSCDLATEDDIACLCGGKSLDSITNNIDFEKSLPLYNNGKLIGCFNRDHDQDEALTAHVLLENLATKASGALVVRDLMNKSAMDLGDVDFIMSCSEEAVGDRYQRGGGNMAKAVAEMGGLLNATGCDIKAFCAGPIYALVHAAALVSSGTFDNVVVFGGGCLSKLGMKFSGHLKHNMPILEDELGAMAFLVTADDGKSPIIRLDSVGKHRVCDGSSQQEILNSLLMRPLDKLGLKISDIDKIATELHNPEVTEPQGSGNVPLNNYKLMAALSVMRGDIARGEMDDFIRQKGMPGFAPTQGHIPAAVPYLGHACTAIRKGQMGRVMFIAKGSLFLGRMSRQSDGLSFILEKNPAQI